VGGVSRVLPPPGTSVRALVEIHDVDFRSRIHARLGDTGVVLGYFGGDDVPTVDWGAGTGFGLYDSPLSELEVVTDACNSNAALV